MTTPRTIPRGACLALVFLLLAPPAGAGETELPTFSKTFIGDIIGPGSTTTLRFDISNPDASPVSDLAFVDNLPGAVRIADPANAFTDCGSASLSAPPGGGTISLSDGSLGGASSCFVTVDVISSTPGTHMNVTGDLTSSAGNSGTATDDLTVDASRPGFTKSFSPSSVVAGDSTTLTLTIDNTLNGGAEDSLSFTDNLPSDLVVASPAIASTDCADATFPSLTATPGSGSITLTDGGVFANSSCSVTVDVATDTAGAKGNTSDDLFYSVSSLPAGKASATLDVTRGFLRKLFTDDPVPPGGTVTLEFTITNFDRSDSATDITFFDDLEATLSGLTAVGLPLNDPCGPGSQLAGGSLLIFSDGSLAPEATCTFSVTVAVPGSTDPGIYVNTTSSVTFDRGGSPVVESPAEDDLVVAPVPVFTKSFVDDPVTGGDIVTLNFSIENTDPVNSATDISFLDELTLFLPFPVSVTLPADDFCGIGSSLDLITIATEREALSLTGASLAGGESCSFDALIDIPVDYPTGTFLNRTTEIAVTINGMTVAGDAATDFLQSVSGATLIKEFTDDPVLPGGAATLEFTLELDEEAPGDVTDIEFTDDLDAVISGLEAIGLPINDVCGAGSQLSGTSLLTLTGGVLSPGASCAFSVSLQVPGGLTPGDNLNTTSAVSGMTLGLAVTSAPANDSLTIAGLSFSKSFNDDPVVPGAVVTLQFSIDNLSATETVTDIEFNDDLDTVLDGLVALGLPLADPCGNGSTLIGSAGDTFLSFLDGTLDPGTGCIFSVDLQVPASAGADDYLNTTSQLSANFGGAAVTVGFAADTLTILQPLSLIKIFLDDPVPPGDQVHLQFVVTNSSDSESVTDISFTDDLDAALSGLAAVDLPTNDVCGTGSQISGTGFLTLTGGNLAPGASCFFTVTLDVPGGVSSPTTATNVTSLITGMIGGLATTGDPATDNLVVEEAVCEAIDGETMTFENDTLDDAQSFELCDVAVFGPNFSIVGPNGFLTIQSGSGAILGNGTSVLDGGRLAIGIDESLKP